MNVSEKDEEGFNPFIKQNENPELLPDNETEYSSNYSDHRSELSYIALSRKKSNSLVDPNKKNQTINELISKKIQQSKRHSEKTNEINCQILDEFKNGPNVNIKLPRKSFNSKEEREFFRNLISNKQKTELCKNWILYNACYFKETCSFAHGEKELRVTNAPINYKTKLCKAFNEKFFCSYGNRCHYSHAYSVNNRRLFNYNFILNQLAKDLEPSLTTSYKSEVDYYKTLQLIQSKKKYKCSRLRVFENIVAEKNLSN